MCEPRNRDNGASDLWTLTAYYRVTIMLNQIVPSTALLLILLFKKVFFIFFPNIEVVRRMNKMALPFLPDRKHSESASAIPGYRGQW